MAQQLAKKGWTIIKSPEDVIVYCTVVYPHGETRFMTGIMWTWKMLNAIFLLKLDFSLRVNSELKWEVSPLSGGQLMMVSHKEPTISGPELFIHMVSDLHTDIPDVKYMDDTTLIEIAKKQRGSNMQHATEQV